MMGSSKGFLERTLTEPPGSKSRSMISNRVCEERTADHLRECGVKTPIDAFSAAYSTLARHDTEKREKATYAKTEYNVWRSGACGWILEFFENRGIRSNSRPQELVAREPLGQRARPILLPHGECSSFIDTNS